MPYIQHLNDQILNVIIHVLHRTEIHKTFSLLLHNFLLSPSERQLVHVQGEETHPQRVDVRGKGDISRFFEHLGRDVLHSPHNGGLGLSTVAQDLSNTEI